MRALGQLTRGAMLEEIDLPEPGPLGEGEVEIAVDHCSVCHSDVHLLDGDWGEPSRPLVPGHEIVGRVIARGSAVTRVNEGARVGLGWQAGACGACAACTSAREHLCAGGKIRTCVAPEGRAARVGGFAERVRCDARFCFDLPEALDPGEAAPLLCAGLTVFSPLERLRVGPGNDQRKRVGVIGVGGLGHLAIRFASALGASVIAFDPDVSKRELARSLGASDLIDVNGALPKNAVDLLLVTTHATLDWTKWMSTVLDLEGTLCLVGIPGAPIEIAADPLLDEQKSITGSVIGSPTTMTNMLKFAAAQGIAPIVERMPFSMRHANDAIARVREGRARMRIVLDRSYDR